MSDWRYWITYEGTVEASDEEGARVAALAAMLNEGQWPTVEVEEVGEGE